MPLGTEPAGGVDPGGRSNSEHQQSIRLPTASELAALPPGMLFALGALLDAERGRRRRAVISRLDLPPLPISARVTAALRAVDTWSWSDLDAFYWGLDRIYDARFAARLGGETCR